MTATNRAGNERVFTGRHMLAVVTLFFGIIIAVNVVMAVYALGTFPGLVVDNSYVASQGYNDLLAEARAQDRAGWQMEISAPAGVVAVRIVNRDGDIERNLLVTALAGRPSSTREDRVIEFYADAEGYTAAEALPPGQWELDIEARRGEALAYRDLRRLFVEPN